MNPFTSLENKVVLITGASSPIGQSISHLLIESGAELALCYHQSKSQAAILKEALRARKVRVQVYKADLTKEKDIEGLIKTVTDDFGSLDALVNNASLFFSTPLGDTKEKDWNLIFETNVRGPFFLIQTALPWLKKSKGSIVNITDLYACLPVLKNHIPYSVSKSALTAMTKAYAHALAPDIRVNAVAPGAITFPGSYTEEQKESIRKRIPLGREGKPEDIAEAVKFLLCGSDYITGEVMYVDGGRSM